MYEFENFGDEEHIDHNDPQGGKSLGNVCQIDNPTSHSLDNWNKQGSQSSRNDPGEGIPACSPGLAHGRQIGNKKSVDYFSQKH